MDLFRSKKATTWARYIRCCIWGTDCLPKDTKSNPISC
nr:MAG TPA: hypothetical protein [Microviridae sp.]